MQTSLSLDQSRASLNNISLPLEYFQLLSYILNPPHFAALQFPHSLTVICTKKSKQPFVCIYIEENIRLMRLTHHENAVCQSIARIGVRFIHSRRIAHARKHIVLEKDIKRPITASNIFFGRSRSRLKKPAPVSCAVGSSHQRPWDPWRRVRNQDSIATVYPAAAALVGAAVPIFVLRARLDSSVRGMPPALASNSGSRLAD